MERAGPKSGDCRLRKSQDRQAGPEGQGRCPREPAHPGTAHRGPGPSALCGRSVSPSSRGAAPAPALVGLTPRLYFLNVLLLAFLLGRRRQVAVLTIWSMEEKKEHVAVPPHETPEATAPPSACNSPPGRSGRGHGSLSPSRPWARPGRCTDRRRPAAHPKTLTGGRGRPAPLALRPALFASSTGLLDGPPAGLEPSASLVLLPCPPGLDWSQFMNQHSHPETFQLPQTTLSSTKGSPVPIPQETKVKVKE